jgi:hypothetical protein
MKTDILKLKQTAEYYYKMEKCPLVPIKKKNKIPYIKGWGKYKWGTENVKKVLPLIKQGDNLGILLKDIVDFDYDFKHKHKHLNGSKVIKHLNDIYNYLWEHSPTRTIKTPSTAEVNGDKKLRCKQRRLKQRKLRKLRKLLKPIQLKNLKKRLKKTI